MNKKFRKIQLSFFLAIIFTMVFSSMAWAYGYNYSYGSYYTPQKYYAQPNYNYNYSNSNYTYYRYTPNYNWNWYYNHPQTPSKQPTPQPEPAPAPTPEPTPQPKPTPAPAPTTGLTAAEKQMVDLVNKERTSQGLKPLQVDMQLVKLARMKSQDMIDNNYFSHTSPTYGSPFEMMKNYGVSYRTAGENLAGAPAVTTAHNNLMNSEGHRKNILNSNFTHIGIGIVEGGKYGQMYTQLFIGK